MNRREFITLLGGAAVGWPVAARAQKSTGQPLVGLLNPLSAAVAAHIVRAFRRGMRDRDYPEGAVRRVRHV
jgi:putative tryptophan/tyrosine transport system substrate-binding protein